MSLEHKIVILIFAILLLLGLGMGLANVFHPKDIKTPQNNSGGLVEGILMVVGGNTLKGWHNPNLPLRTQVLGSIMDKVILCESSWDNSKRGKAGEIGIAQFMPQTWEWMCELADFRGDIYNEQDQLKMIQWAFENGYAKHWTCYKILVN